MMELRCNLKHLTRSHFGAYRHARTGAMGANLVFEVVAPVLIAGAASATFGLAIGGTLAAALVGAAMICALAFMCALLAVALITSNWAIRGDEGSAATSRRAVLLEQITASCAYATVVATGAGVAFAAAALAPDGPARVAATAIGLAAFAHVAITGAMVLRRLVVATTATLTDIRVGAIPPIR